MNAGNVISWNALIAEYTKHGRSHEALSCFDRMQGQCIIPNPITYLCALKACSSIGAVDKGKQIHIDVVSRSLLERNHVLGTALVGMYAKCGVLAKARQVHEELHIRDVVSWSALIGGYAQHGQVHEAWDCFESMQGEGLSPNHVTFLCILQACGRTCAIDKGRKAHDEIVNRGNWDRNALLGTALVDMYAKCGNLAEAQQVHNELHAQDIVSWSALITGYTHHGRGYEALKCFEDMQGQGLPPDVITFVCILKVCGSVGDIEKGESIHNQIVSQGLLEKSVVIGTSLVDMYVKFGLLGKAQQVHEEIHARDGVSWSVLISGYAQHGQGHEALNLFEQMQSEGLSPNMVTYLGALKACGCTGFINKGKQIHDEIVNRRLLIQNSMLGTALVDMYAKCGMLSKAQEVHDSLHIRDMVSYCALIGGFAEYGRGREALNCYAQMEEEGFSPDVVTLVYILKACGIIGAIVEGKRIHDEIVSRNLLENSVALGAALVDMYAKCGMLRQAQEEHEKLRVRDSVSWNALIAGYIQQGQGREAFTCFEQMQGEGLSPNKITFLYILKACSTIGTISEGKLIHNMIASHENALEKNTVLGSALVDMYARCGSFTKARELHDKLTIRNLISWSALIEGYVQQGHVCEALNCIEQMQREGLCPDAVIFLILLNACSHLGLLDEAETCFGTMIREYDIKPTLEHYTCMIVVFGCAGHFDKAMSVMKMMPSFEYPAIWLALLGACRKWGNVKLGMKAFDQAVQLDSGGTAAYVLMADLFAASAMEMDVEKINPTAVRLDAFLSYEN